jgi:hypothetical protein
VCSSDLSVTPRVSIDRPTAKQFSDLGVHRLVLIPPQNADISAVEQFIGTVGGSLVGQV